MFALLVLAVMISPAFVALDEAASSAFLHVGSPALDPAFETLTRLGDFWVMVGLTAVAAVVLAVIGRRSESILLIGVMIIGSSVGVAAKDLVERARPGLEHARIALPDSYSFPSGHALGAFLFFGTLAFIALMDAKTLRGRVWAVAVCAVLIVLVGISRVYLGVHWFGDITASWILGFGLMSLATALYIVVTAGEAEAPA
jgi:undecaprenyl-diphosphatase